MTPRELLIETLEFYKSGQCFGYDHATERCHYLTIHGLRCAIGRCIDINRFALHGRQGTITALRDTYGLIRLHLLPQYRSPSIHWGLWYVLQTIHDHWARGEYAEAWGKVQHYCALAEFPVDESWQHTYFQKNDGAR